MPLRGPVSVLVYPPDEAQAYARLIRAPRGRVRVRVASSPTEALPYIEEMDVLFTWGFPSQLLPGARRLRWVQVMGAGVDKFLDAPFPPRVVLTRAVSYAAHPRSRPPAPPCAAPRRSTPAGG